MVGWTQVTDFACQFAGVYHSTSYGEPSLKIGKKLLTRHRVKDNSIVLKGVDFDERDELVRSRPDVFFLEDHYANYDIVLAKLTGADLDQLSPFIIRTWRMLAPKREVEAYDQRQRQGQ